MLNQQFQCCATGKIPKSKLLGNPEVETNGKSRSLNSIDDVPDSYYSAILSIVLKMHQNSIGLYKSIEDAPDPPPSILLAY